MIYTVIISDRVKKQFEKLNKDANQRIVAVLQRICIRPYPHVKKLVGCPYFSLRAGDYRIILDIKDDKLIILVIEVGHRKKVYKTI